MKKLIGLLSIAFVLLLSVPTHLNAAITDNIQKKVNKARQRVLQLKENSKSMIAKDVVQKLKKQAELKPAESKPAELKTAELYQLLLSAIIEKDKAELKGLLDHPMIAQALKDQSLLMTAVSEEDREISEMIIRKIKTFRDAKTYLDPRAGEESALLEALFLAQLTSDDEALKNNLYVATLLIEAGASVNVKDAEEGTHPLISAALLPVKQGNNEFYKTLIDAYQKLPNAKASLNAVDTEGSSAYYYALRASGPKFISMLEDADADEISSLNLFAESLADLIDQKEVEKVGNYLISKHADKFLSTSYVLNVSHSSPEVTPLTRAILQLPQDADKGAQIITEILNRIKTLPKPGQYLDAKDSNSLTPLLYAVELQDLKTVQDLIEAGASLDLTSSAILELPPMNALEYAKFLQGKLAGDEARKVGEIIAFLEAKK